MIYIEKDERLKFKQFECEDELLVSDDGKSINAYIMASDSLVRSVIDLMEKEAEFFEMPIKDFIEHDDTTMNFYADYNPETNNVSLEVCLEGPDALYEEFSLCLNSADQKRLIGAIEQYAIDRDGMSCEEILEDVALEVERNNGEER